jgi:large subunit ribosomal protein L10
LEEQLTRVLQGPTLAIFCKGDPTSPAKTLVALHRELEPLNVYGGLLGERVLSQADFELLASLPGRDVMLARVVGTLQAPIAGFVGVLSGVLRSLLYVLQARAQQLQEAAA